jgi:hypothetical protein
MIKNKLFIKLEVIIYIWERQGLSYKYAFCFSEKHKNTLSDRFINDFLYPILKNEGSINDVAYGRGICKLDNAKIFFPHKNQ